MTKTVGSFEASGYGSTIWQIMCRSGVWMRMTKVIKVRA